MELSSDKMLFCLFICFLNAVLVSAACRGDSCPVCPETPPCRCDDKIANCSSLGYTSFPEIGDFEYLDFSNNNFAAVVSRALPINSVVKNLDLSSNNITKLYNGSFEGAPYLETIILADNKLIHLADNAFTKLKNLTKLDLSGNALAALNDVSFVPNMTMMTDLSLRNNKFIALPDITAFIFPNLQRLDLSGNELQCDTSLKWILTWLAKGGKSLMGECSGPTQLAGKSLDSILPQQFDDPSYVEPTPGVLTTNKMSTTVKDEKNPVEPDDGPNAAAIVLPILFILILVIVLAILFWKKYWQPRHEAEKKYSAVNREQNAGNRVYSDTTTDL